MAAGSDITVNPHVYRRMAFDALKDLVPVASIYRSQFVLTVHPSVPAKTLPEFVAHARKADPPLRYASAGPGSMHHLGIEMLKQRAGINLTHVPYPGGAPAGRATAAGAAEVVLAGGGAVELIRQGKLRALATTGAERLPLFPDIASIADLYPGYDLTNWAGVFAPAGTPQPIVSRLRAEIHRALAEAAVAGKLRAIGPEPLILPAEEFSALVRRDYEKYGRLVKDIGLAIE